MINLKNIALLATVSLNSFFINAEEKPLEIETVKVEYTYITGVGKEKEVMRRDPSDIIKVGDLYYVWYSKGKIAPGYDATVWYATSPDGLTWTEKGMALAKGKAGTWEGASVFTPNILVAEGKYWLFYTGTSNEFTKGFNPDSKIGLAVSDSPDGPWERTSKEPVLKNSDNPKDFDSHLVDDSCIIVREGKYWFYYKGRQLGKSPSQTQMGLAVADKPQGPYIKHKNNPVIPGNHEVVIWSQGKGVAALIGTVGPKNITRSILFSEDGLKFKKVKKVIAGPHGAGTYRPNGFTDQENQEVKWGIELRYEKGALPFLRRFDIYQQ
ncbi:MAG: family 43 glycosylhydrolase [Lentisphaeraceae bacterium]|nr:family 43 glycosylhydrolase [Lentisphaeraceae bacterium]